MNLALDILLPIFYFTTVPYVVGTCVLRLNAINIHQHRYLWAIMYIFFAAFACGELLDVIVLSQWPSEGNIVGLIAIILNLYLTHSSWRVGPPSIVERRFK